MISAAFPFKKQRRRILGREMAYVEVGAGGAQSEVTVKGVHFVQEDSPDEIGRAIAGWMGRLG